MGTQTGLIIVITGLLLITAILLYKSDEISVWCTRKINQWIKTRQAKLRVKDAANPKRVEQRAKRKILRDKIGMYTFFLAALVLLPVGGVALGLQQRSVSNEAWALIIVATVQGALGVWAVVIGAALKKDDQKSDSENTEP